MMQKHSHQSVISQGFAILAQCSEYNHDDSKACNELLSINNTINFIKLQLNKIYSNKILQQCDIDIIHYISSFLSNLAWSQKNILSVEFISITIGMFKSIHKYIQNQESEFINMTMFNIIQIIRYISNHHFYIKEQLSLVLSENNDSLLTTIFKYSNFNKSFFVRISTLGLIQDMISDIHLATLNSAQFKKLVQYSITEVKEFINRNNINYNEKCYILGIFHAIIQYGNEKYYYFILDDDDIMNIIYHSIQSHETKHWLFSIRCILYILNNAQTGIIQIYLKESVPYFDKLLNWKQGLIISALCKWVKNYHIISKNKYNATGTMELFNFFRDFVIMIKNKCIKEKYIKNKFNENNLIQNMIINKLIMSVDNKLILNQVKLNEISNNESKIDKWKIIRFGYDILYIITLCQNHFVDNEDRYLTIQKIATEQGFEPEFNCILKPMKLR